MPTLLSDPTRSVYLLLFVFVVATGAVAFRYQSRKSLAWFGAAVALLLSLWLCDFLFESPREESIRRIQAIKQALNDRKRDALLENVSNTFEYRGKKRADLPNSWLWSVLDQYDARVEVWDFNRDNVQQPDDNTLLLGFMAKGESAEGRQTMMYIMATFVRDPDGAFRLRTMKAFNPMNRSEEVSIPF